MITNYSPEQREIKNAYISRNSLHVKYLDLVTALESILNISSSYLANAHRIAICIDQPEISDILYDLIGKKNLSHLVFKNDSTEAIDDTMINYLRGELKQELNYSNITIYQLNEELIGEKHQVLIDQFSTLNSNVHGETTISDLISIIMTHNMQSPHADLNFTVEDPSNEKFYRLKRALTDVQDIYDELFEIFGKTTSLKVSAREGVSDADMVNQYKNEINAIIDQARQLKNKYSFHKDVILKAYKNERELHNMKHLELITKTKESLLRKKISLSTDGVSGGMMTGFFKKSGESNPYLSIFNEFKAESGLPIRQDPLMEYDEIENFLNQIKNDLRLDTKYQKDFNQKLTQLNKLNSEDSTIIALDGELNELMNDLNGSGIFSTVFENNVLSFTRQMDLLDEIIKELSGIKSLLHSYPNYLSWRLIIQDKECDIYPIISALRDYPKSEWITIFERSYFNKLVENALLSGLPSSYEPMKELSILIDQQVNLLPDYLSYKLYKKRKTSIDNLKSNHKDIHQALFKKKLPTTLTYKELYDTAPEFVDSFFLIQLNKSVENVDEKIGIKFNFIEGSANREGWINYTKMMPEDFDKIDNETTYPLYLNHLEYSIPIEKLGASDRLKAAKKLAKMLLSITQDVNIYQLKNANIISTLNKTDNHKAISILEESGIKIIEGNNLYDRLTESLLESRRNQYILTKNGIINSVSANDLLWQSYILRKCIELGIENINFWSKNEYINDHELDALLHDLKSDKEGKNSVVESQVI